MTIDYPSIEAIANQLDHTKKVIDSGALVYPKRSSKTKFQYEDLVKKIDYWKYIESADYHYFVSRVFWYGYVPLYSFFSGYQCIENYLKGYLKSKNLIPPNIHDLDELLENCRNCAPSTDAFLHHHHVETIILKYGIFYELPRYPVYKQGPQEDYGFVIPDDIYFLDYFVYQMRALLPVKGHYWDILGKGHFQLQLCQKNFPEFYQLFFKDNINFKK